HCHVIVQPVLKAVGSRINFNSVEGGEPAIFRMQHVTAGIRISMHTPIPHLVTLALAEFQVKVQHCAVDLIFQLRHRLLPQQPEIKAVVWLWQCWEGK
uniref:Uncharacterized protein n=1 Tax=Romanomermis culicivorax TaxID=13658 RepID=A0A915K3U5_ROMCU